MLPRTVRIAVLALLGLVLAGGLGYAAHRLAGDTVGLSTAALRAGETLAPLGPPAPVPPATNPVATTPDASGGGDASSGNTTVASAPEPGPEPAAPTTGAGEPGQDGASRAPRARLAAGRTVFVTNCAACHTLADAGASGSVGPDLDALAPTRTQVAAQVRSGGGGMPSFEGALSDREIADVALYVAHATGTPAEPAAAPPAPAEPGSPAQPPAAPAEPPSPAAPPAAPSPAPVTTDDDGGGGDDSSGPGSDDDGSGRGRGRGRGGDDRDD